MSKHTPGPWLPKGILIRGAPTLQTPKGLAICRVFETFDGNKTHNTRLIAAAPEMLEALKLALQHVPRDAMVFSEGDHGERVYVLDVLTAAFEKATGEDTDEDDDRETMENKRLRRAENGHPDA